MEGEYLSESVGFSIFDVKSELESEI